jgi:hypothetical protein
MGESRQSPVRPFGIGVVLRFMVACTKPSQLIEQAGSDATLEEIAKALGSPRHGLGSIAAASAASFLPRLT